MIRARFDPAEMEKPTPVRLHHIPNWLRRRLLALIGCEGGDTSAWGVLQYALSATDSDGLSAWFDHWGSTTLLDGSPAFVSEPYPLGPRGLGEVERFARAAGLDFWIEANSEWNPGSTLRIVFVPNEDADIHIRGMERMQSYLDSHGH